MAHGVPRGSTLVFLAFGVEVAFSAVIIIFLLANLIGILSALPGGMGSMESPSRPCLSFSVFSGSVAGSIAIVDRLISFWFVTALRRGLLILLCKGHP